eukprot:9497732-Pyramimonas_sp.AAC.1
MTTGLSSRSASTRGARKRQTLFQQGSTVPSLLLPTALLPTRVSRQVTRLRGNAEGNDKQWSDRER